MTAFVGRMVAGRGKHNIVKPCAESVVRKLFACIVGYESFPIILHPLLEVGQSFTADGYGAVFPGLGFGLTHDKVTLF